MGEKKSKIIRPVVVHEKDCPKEEPDRTHFGDAAWRTLLSSDITPSSFMTCGIVEIGQWRGGKMKTHQHPQAEIYHVLAGEGIVTVEGIDHPVCQGSTLFIPGGSEHGTRNEGENPLKIFYVFAVDSFKEVEYFIPEEDN